MLSNVSGEADVIGKLVQGCAGRKCGKLLRVVCKGKIKMKIILEQATKAQRGIRGIALLFL
jgi:hypothetical protein